MKFNDFRELNNEWRKYKQKQPNHWFLIALYYPFFCIIAHFFFRFLARTIKNRPNKT
jgi:hypothetical protein